LPFELRPYQIKAVKRAYDMKNGILLSDTSSGKTIILYVLCQLVLNKLKDKEKILIIVPRKLLVNQGCLDFIVYSKNLDSNFAKCIKTIHSEFDKVILDEQKIIISTWQSLNNFDEPNFFESIKYLFVDEVHSTGSESNQSDSEKIIVNIIQQCINTKCRIGLTGTLYKDDEEEDLLKRYTIEGLFGRATQITDSLKLQEKGYIANIIIKGVIFDYGQVPDSKMASYADEIKFYKRKKAKIDFIINKSKKIDKNIIVLFSRASPL
jgi:superfamily II DNA or RNA helicase